MITLNKEHLYIVAALFLAFTCGLFYTVEKQDKGPWDVCYKREPEPKPEKNEKVKLDLSRVELLEHPGVFVDMTKPEPFKNPKTDVANFRRFMAETSPTITEVKQ